MQDNEIPLGKRTIQYRFFEIVPAIISYGAIILLVVLALVNPLLASVYLLLVVVTMIVKAAGIAVHVIGGTRRLRAVQRVDWRKRLLDIEGRSPSYSASVAQQNEVSIDKHIANVTRVAESVSGFPKPSELYNLVIIAAYNESIEVLEPTVQSLIDTTYDKKRLIVTIAYEERGGRDIARTVATLKERYGSVFYSLQTVCHPAGMEGEVIGKGGNITYAGQQMQEWLDHEKIAYENVIVTTLDSDNKPDPQYFDYLTYEYVVHENRKHLAFQPICLFFSNIWDVPAPMRVVATGNSFWNIISSMRPHMLRNFASHSQPMDALVEMDFWSKRTIVEDGHQYWRSYFHFDGDYSVVPLYVPIQQDAVLSETYVKTLKAQFVQLRRWAYGASDVPFVATRILSRHRSVPLFAGLGRLFRLLDGHITLATVSILIAVGGWVPLLLNPEAARSVVAHQLPEVVSVLMQAALLGLLITIFLSLRLLPKRPARYMRHRTVFMVLQWLLMPVIAIVYNAISAFNAQTRLALGRYMDKFDVTDKKTITTTAKGRKKH